MTKTDYIRIRMTPELKEILRQLAAEENRTITNYIENLIIREFNKK